MKKFVIRREFTNARQGFGSFHCEDIEVIIRQSHGEYRCPSAISSIQDSVRRSMLMSIDLDSHFMLDKSWTFINHGAFGAALLPLLDQSIQLKYLTETQPLQYFDRILLPCVAHCVREFAAFLSCKPIELLPLQNVTAGLNSAINSVHVDKGDEIVCLSLTYGSTKKMLKDLCARKLTNYNEVHLSLPIESEYDILQKFSKKLSARTKLVVLDQITSNTAMELPIRAMAHACKAIAPGCVVIVDGAHSLFALNVSMRETAVQQHDMGEETNFRNMSEFCDIWLTNGHKWLCGPKGSAFMWVSPNMARRVRPIIISHGFTAAPPAAVHSSLSSSSGAMLDCSTDPMKMLSSFAWDGCRDYTALLVTPAALAGWRLLNDHHAAFAQWRSVSAGDNGVHNTGTVTEREGAVTGQSVSAVRSMMRALLKEATALLQCSWGLSADDMAAPLSMRSHSPMSLVPLPDMLQGRSTRSGTTDQDAFRLQELLHHQHRIEVPVKCLEGRLYVRISAHVYNSLANYQHLASVVKQLVNHSN